MYAQVAITTALLAALAHAAPQDGTIFGIPDSIILSEAPAIFSDLGIPTDVLPVFDAAVTAAPSKLLAIESDVLAYVTPIITQSAFLSLEAALVAEVTALPSTQLAQLESDLMQTNIAALISDVGAIVATDTLVPQVLSAVESIAVSAFDIVASDLTAVATATASSGFVTATASVNGSVVYATPSQTVSLFTGGVGPVATAGAQVLMMGAAAAAGVLGMAML